jgi:hypothetical protein
MARRSHKADVAHQGEAWRRRCGTGIASATDIGITTSRQRVEPGGVERAATWVWQPSSKFVVLGYMCAFRFQFLVNMKLCW